MTKRKTNKKTYWQEEKKQPTDKESEKKTTYRQRERVREKQQPIEWEWQRK